jgi:ferredoxin
VQKPARLERNREALAILLLIATIMVTDFAFDGFRFALNGSADPGIAHERSFALGGDAVAAVFSGPLALHRSGRATTCPYWIQMLSVLGFLVILPLGEHFHIVTALPALYFRRGAPANRVPTVNLEALMDGNDADLAIGIRTARDLTWKDGLDAFTCTECGRCKDACPTFVTGKPLSLKAVHDDLKRHLIAQRGAIVGGETIPRCPARRRGHRAGNALGVHDVRLLRGRMPDRARAPAALLRMRQHQVLMEGAFPHELKAVFDAYEVQSNPWGLPADTRGDWAKELGVPIVQTGGEMRALDYPFLCRVRRIVRSARTEDRRRVRKDPRARGRDIRDSRRARDIDR